MTKEGIRKKISYNENQIGTQVITMKWCGVIFLVSGIVWLIIKIFQSAYVNKHVQDNMNNGAMYQKVTICPGCGLQQ